MDTRQVFARFDAERQALAMTSHPNIARVLDAGATVTGRPYFVMEFVPGIPMTTYCDQQSLPVAKRLHLFIQVCEAIQHAHQKAVIHRDIKPSNILVTLCSSMPVPKVIDFGIAKATEGRLTDGTVYTHFLHFVGTPAYMSPEQADLTGSDSDTRSDIYSLGVLLYELLTGTTPFEGQQLIASGLDRCREPSAKRSRRSSRRLSHIARETDANNGKPEAAFRGPRFAILLDLNWVVMECLEKDRFRRYQTVSALTADIQRHLSNETVVARPRTPFYRLQKTVRRKRFSLPRAQ